MSDELLVDIGMMLAALPRPMNSDEVRRFANDLVNKSVDQSPLSIASLAWIELEPRGGNLDQAEALATAVLNVVDPKRGLSLSAARKIIGAIWAGTTLMK
jgi:hypothetical protein